MKKVIVVCVAVVLFAFGGWVAVNAISAGSDRTGVGSESTSAAPVETHKDRRRSRADAAGTSGEAAVVPVDLAKVDPDREIAGFVLGADGAPVGGARVVVRMNGWKRLCSWLQMAESEGPSTRTAPDGSFSVPFDPATPGELVVRAAGYPEQIRSGWRTGQRVTIRLARGASLDVEVIDADERPVQGATVYSRRTLTYGELLQETESVTGADGVARFAAVLPGYASLEVGVPGVIGRHWARVRVPRDQPFRIVLPERATIEGTVTDRHTGEPVPGAVVTLEWTTDPGVQTGEKGRYTLVTWKRKGTITIEAKAPGYGTELAKVAAPGTVDLRIDRAFTVRGRVVSEDGKPVADARAGLMENPKGTQSQVNTTRQVAPDGTFSMEATPGAIHVLIVAAPGRQRVVVELPAVPSDGQTTLELGDVVLPRGRRIAGVVIDADGKPYAGDVVRVSVPWPTGAERTFVGSLNTTEIALTDDLGRFRFDALAPGTWNVHLSTVDAPQIEPVVVVLPADRDVEDVRLGLQGSRTLRVRVIDDAGEPIPEASVQVMGEFGVAGRVSQPVLAHTDTDGRLRIRGLPSHPVRLFANVTIDRPYVRVGETPPVNPEGQEVTLVLARAVALKGQVLDETGAPVAAHYVDARLAGQTDASGMGVTGTDGSFEIMVPAGQSVDLKLREWRSEKRADGAMGSVATEYSGSLPGVRGPQTGLMLRATKVPQALDCTLDVLLLDPDGRPISNVEVTANWELKGERATTDDAGRAHLANLPARSVRVSFWTGTRREKLAAGLVPPAPFEVVPTSQEVRATFRRGVELRGRVVDAKGNPCRASISVRNPEFVYTLAQCDAEGRFAVAALPGIAHVVEADFQSGTAERAKASRAGVVPGAGEIELVVRPPAK